MKSKITKYTRGPSMQGVQVVKDFLPPAHMLTKKMRPKKVPVSIDPHDLEILEKEASRRHKPSDEFMGGILRAYAEALQ